MHYNGLKTIPQQGKILLDFLKQYLLFFKTSVSFHHIIEHTIQGRSRDFREGGAEYARAKRTRKFWPHPLTRWQGQSSNYHRERILTVASKLESTLLTEFRDKVSLWLSSKGVLNEAVLWTMLTRS